MTCLSLYFFSLCKVQGFLQPFSDWEGVTRFHNPGQVMGTYPRFLLSSSQCHQEGRRVHPKRAEPEGSMATWRRRDMVESVAWVHIQDFKGASATVKQTLCLPAK